MLLLATSIDKCIMRQSQVLERAVEELGLLYSGSPQRIDELLLASQLEDVQANGTLVVSLVKLEFLLYFCVVWKRLPIIYYSKEHD